MDTVVSSSRPQPRPAADVRRGVADVLASFGELVHAWQIAPADAPSAAWASSALDVYLGVDEPIGDLRADTLWRSRVAVDDLVSFDAFVELAVREGTASLTYRIVAADRSVRRLRHRLRSRQDTDGTLWLEGLVMPVTAGAALPAVRSGDAGDGTLTPRQSEVLALLCLGYGTSEIARRLWLSDRTVRNHVNGAIRALGVRSRAEAVAAAYRLGLA